MTDSNGVKPRNEELLRLLEQCAECEVNDLMFLKPELAAYLARAELKHRQQPEASVPAELVEQWYNEWALTVQSGELCKDLAQHIADCTAAAYGRGQSQWVPVSERLPKDGQRVIYWIENAEFAGLGRFDPDSRMYHGSGGWVNQDDVTHWMPLEPPTC